MSIKDLERARRLYVENLKGESMSYGETYIMRFMHHTINMLKELEKLTNVKLS